MGTFYLSGKSIIRVRRVLEVTDYKVGDHVPLRPLKVALSAACGIDRGGIVREGSGSRDAPLLPHPIRGNTYLPYYTHPLLTHTPHNT